MCELEDAYSLLQCETLDALTHAADKVASSMGFMRFLFGLRIDVASPAMPPVKMIGTFPEGWLQTYAARGYAAIDPTVQHAYASNLPLVWGPGVFTTPEQVQFAEEAAKWGLTAGFSAPVRGKDNDLSLLSLVVDDDSDKPLQLRVDQLANGQLLACFIHEAMTRVLNAKGAEADAVQEPALETEAATQAADAPAPAQESIALSRRELDCLTWSAAGKTSWEIGRILSISERTVNFHIAKAARKLGTYSRRHAISRAMALGLLSP
ncbi:LuxR family quorum-sensing transcriptional regulator LasR [Trinickia symbiotica]|nr:LuxR family transcriptional regulator [Trinickia symbiotica]PPK46430.1 LuxR family quorum-sensing transcriptional regulator LasR [Trinickia symbiotica]